MEALGSAPEALKCICDPMSRRIGYVYYLESNFVKLYREVQTLRCRVEDVNRKISGKRTTSECEGWLKEVEEIQKRLKEIEDLRAEKCLGGWCPNVFSRWRLGKRVVNLISEIIEHTEKSEFKEDIVIDEPQKIMEMPAPRIEVNTAADRTLQELLGMIKEVNIKRIGLWGLGGIGKTTIMTALHSHPEIGQMFEIVLWVTVSKEGTDRNVRDELARRLLVKREDGESSDSLKSKVCEALKAKKFLLFLDDVWEMIDLDEVGIPRLDEGSGCKVVLSTRLRTVCNKMETDKEIKVEALPKQEAWSLFRRKVGEVADYREIKPYAREIVRECCGLPLAILVVGGGLRNEEDIHVWRNDLKKLRSPASEIEDMERKVYQILKYSYDRLKDERSKERFLYCALFPEDWSIPKVELIQYWGTEGLIDGWNNLEEAEDEGFSRLKDLMDASLLEKGTDWWGTDLWGADCVKMHDVMRDLALRISSAKDEGCTSLVKAGVKLSEAPKAEDWEKVKRISLMKNWLETLPPRPNCPMLTTLLLQENRYLKEIPPQFFEHMPALQVLDLSGTGIKSLPPSIGRLGNLRGLYLNDCERLKTVPWQVGALAKLEIIQMRGQGTKVFYLPPEIEDLASLKHFEVRCRPPVTSEEEEEEEELQLPVMKMFPKISKLSGLERLRILADAEDDEWWGEYSEGVTEEIIMLNKLTDVSLSFSKIEHLEHFVRESPSWKQRSLTSFIFSVGREDANKTLDLYRGFVPQRHQDGISLRRSASDKMNFPFKDDSKKIMLYKSGNMSDEMREILRCVDTFAVGGNVVVQRLSDFGMENMNMLKFCFLASKDIETIIDDGDYGKQKSELVPSLQELVLWNLPNLKSIWEGPLPPPHQRRCFPSLRYLFFFGCSKLKRILSRGLIQHLSNLERLSVKECLEVEEIIGMDKEGEMVAGELHPQLKILSLTKLPKLTCICSKELSSAGWPSLEQIGIDSCENLKSLPHGFAKAKIYCDESWWEALEWEDATIKRQFHPKFSPN